VSTCIEANEGTFWSILIVHGSTRDWLLPRLITLGPTSPSFISDPGIISARHTPFDQHLTRVQAKHRSEIMPSASATPRKPHQSSLTWHRQHRWKIQRFQRTLFRIEIRVSVCSLIQRHPTRHLGRSWPPSRKSNTDQDT